MRRQVFVTGGTGYLGRPLVAELVARGHGVRALVRPGLEGRLPAGALSVPGNALDGSSFASHVPPSDTLAATFVRPWYVLGPGHRWPYLLVPLYAVLRWLPSTREGARRLGLVTRPQMIRALVGAVELGPSGIRVVDVEQIRSAKLPV